MSNMDERTLIREQERLAREAKKKKTKKYKIAGSAVLAVVLIGGIWYAGWGRTLLAQETVSEVKIEKTALQQLVIAQVKSIYGNELTYTVAEKVENEEAEPQEGSDKPDGDNAENFNRGEGERPEGMERPDAGEMPDMSEFQGEFPGGGGMPDMGSFPGGGGMPDMGSFPGGGSMPDMSGSQGNAASGTNSGTSVGAFMNLSSNAGGGMPNMGGFPGGGEMPDMSGFSGGFPGGGEMPDMSEFQGGFPGGDFSNRGDGGNRGNTAGTAQASNQITYENETYQLGTETVTAYIPVGTDVITKLGTVTTFSRLAAGDYVALVMDNVNGENVIAAVYIIG